MIFTFKITNQTQLSDLWFSFFPFKNHKHKHKHKLTRLRRTEPRKKKKMENEVEWGRVTLVAMGEEDEMRGAGDCATVWDRRRRGWNRVERVESLGPVTLTESLERRRRLGTAARVGPAVRELDDLALSEWGWGLREGGRRGFWLLSLLSEGGRELVLKNRRNERMRD